MKTRISKVLEEKGGDVYSVKPDDMVFDALQLMANHKIGAVMILHGEHPLGIFTERDYMNKIILKDHSSKNVMIKDVMTSKLVVVSPDTQVDEALAVMTEQHCRHLPIIENKKLVGIVSIGDLVRRVIKDQDVAIKSLSEYIALSY